MGLFQHITNQLASTDILLKLNIIELLANLVETSHGFTYLESKQVISKVFDYFNPDANLLDVQICEPGKKFHYFFKCGFY